MNIAVLASGNGTNLQSIIDCVERGDIKAKIVCVISDKKDAFALERAKKHNIPAFFVDTSEIANRNLHASARSKKTISECAQEHAPAVLDTKGKTREEHEKEIVKILKKHNVELVVLAGYMKLLTPVFISAYRYKIINIHPALLPSFPGTDGYGDAFKYGVKVSGCTVHFVDEGCDTGPIILQKTNPINDDDTLESFRERGLKIEHKALPEAINLFISGKLKIEGKKVRVLK